MLRFCKKNIVIEKTRYPSSGKETNICQILNDFQIFLFSSNNGHAFDYPIPWLNPVTFLCLSQAKTWISIVKCHGRFCFQWGGCSFCWYWWNFSPFITV